MEGQYLVMIQVSTPRGPHQSVRCKLTYEVTHLRPGQNKWSLVSKEEQPAPSGSTSAEHSQSAFSK
jgi:hypothetical protein